MVINKVSQKTIVAIIIIILLSIIMSVSSLAWEGYPNTPISDKYDNSYIYQVIFKWGNNIWMVVSQNPFYRSYTYNDKLETGSTVHLIKYVNGNWEYYSNLGTVGKAYDEILQSTHDIYTNSTKSNVFFSATRLTTIQKTLIQHPPLSLMNPLIRGITPFLIGLVIALVAFWKAWKFLFKTLRKA